MIIRGSLISGCGHIFHDCSKETIISTSLFPEVAVQVKWSDRPCDGASESGYSAPVMSSLVDSASLGGGGGAAGESDLPGNVIIGGKFKMTNHRLTGLPGSAGQQRDELKTQFMTREGLYKLMTLSEYSRPNRYVGWLFRVSWVDLTSCFLGDRLTQGINIIIPIYLCLSTSQPNLEPYNRVKK